MYVMPMPFWQRLAGVGALCLGLLGCPVVVAAPSISAWSSTTMAVKADGTLLSWGYECCARSQGSETPVQLSTGVDRAFTAYSNLSALTKHFEEFTLEKCLDKERYNSFQASGIFISGKISLAHTFNPL